MPSVLFITDQHQGWQPSSQTADFELVGEGEVPSVDRLGEADVVLVKGLNQAERALQLGGFARRALARGAVIVVAYELRPTDPDLQFIAQFADISMDQTGAAEPAAIDPAPHPAFAELADLYGRSGAVFNTRPTQIRSSLIGDTRSRLPRFRLRSTAARST